MNWINARCSFAIAPLITTKRELAILVAASKSSNPKRSPNSTWSFGSNAKFIGSPQRRISLLSSSVFPAGTDSCGILGIPSKMVFNSFWTFPSSSSLAFKRSPNDATSSNRGCTSSLCAFAAPMAFERSFRSCCNSCVLTCRSLRSFSSRSIDDASSEKPRFFNAFKIFLSSFLNRCGSSINNNFLLNR